MHADIYEALSRALDDERLVFLATVIAGPDAGEQILVWPSGEHLGDLGGARITQRAALYAHQTLPHRPTTRRKSFETRRGEVEVFFEVLAPPDRLIVVGAVHVAIPLVRFARELGFATVVIDPREAFATAERFPHADRLLRDWPDRAMDSVGLNEGSHVAVLSHDIKLDLPALERALASPAAYIGALGSSRTHAKRVAALAEKGFGDDDLARIHSPIGFDLGGRRAEEIALAVMAEIVAVRHGKR